MGGWEQTGWKKKPAAEGTTSAAGWRLMPLPLLSSCPFTCKHTTLTHHQLHPFKTARAKEGQRKREREEKRAKLWRIRSGRERRNKGVNGFFVIKELVYFRAYQSNSQGETARYHSLCPCFSPSLPAIGSLFKKTHTKQQFDTPGSALDH